MYSINKKGRDFGVSFIVVNSHLSRTELNGLFFEKKVTMYVSAYKLNTMFTF